MENVGQSSKRRSFVGLVGIAVVAIMVGLLIAGGVIYHWGWLYMFFGPLFGATPHDKVPSGSQGLLDLFLTFIFPTGPLILGVCLIFILGRADSLKRKMLVAVVFFAISYLTYITLLY